MRTIKNNSVIAGICLLAVTISVSFKKSSNENNYRKQYELNLNDFKEKQERLIGLLASNQINEDFSVTRENLNLVRISMKQMDFWLRYLEPVTYKQINGPLPVEWETEVFEKYEKPYKREGSGLTLARLYLEEEHMDKDSLSKLIHSSLKATAVFANDSITKKLGTFHHFFLCNRLYLLNLACIYTTGFECPDPERIIPELRTMMSAVSGIYLSYNESFPETPLTENYFEMYRSAIMFVNEQPVASDKFDHFTFLKDFVNPLFSMNQQLIRQYNVQSQSTMDYSLNKNSGSIFSKSLYNAQNTKGVFTRVHDKDVLKQIEALGKMLFYDPILSGNNLRSCASCHKPELFFTDTVAVSRQFDRRSNLPRNTPTLLNAQFNHLIMLDGSHQTLHSQARAVITSTNEMHCSEKEMLSKVLSCEDYRNSFNKLLKHTPHEPAVSMEHISSALVMYYSKFSQGYSPFDEAITNHKPLDDDIKKGFNIFMSKAQCGTCHFAPQFNGVKPPYVGSEFEVLGTPHDTGFSQLSSDKGRFGINPATETANAFRTGTLRNISRTKPYMHNGVFNTLNEVLDFYNAGGGSGRGLNVPNQTLSQDSLHLTDEDKKHLTTFLLSLDEKITPDQMPLKLPLSKHKKLNTRIPGGEY